MLGNRIGGAVVLAAAQRVLKNAGVWRSHWRGDTSYRMSNAFPSVKLNALTVEVMVSLLQGKNSFQGGL